MANAQATAVHGSRPPCGYEVRTTPPSEVDIELPAFDTLSEELQRLAQVNQELLGQLRGGPAPAEAPAPAAATNAAEADALRRENAELRARVAELEQVLAAAPSEDAWAERQREYEALLDEKSEVIRALHLKLQEALEGPRRAAHEPPPREEELRLIKIELEDQRRQLQEDEESLMAQMRQMELALSKDRAELARQRQEVQRLQTELNREIEQAARDPGLRERLVNLRRLVDGKAEKKEPAAAPPPPAAPKDDKQQSGLFRRLFG